MPDDFRTDSERDCDRIHYSSAYRRLAGVTQVVAVNEIQLFHNRLTHTNKVALLARRLAQDLVRDPANADTLAKIGGIDEAVAEAAALAHDLGHPPFGHIAEEVLATCCDTADADGFEGNAQSFRIVTKLARRASDEPGLNLGERTLRGILKYPWLRGEAPQEGASPEEHLRRRKWGAYRSEKRILESITAESGDARSVEAEIMDLCDDISYALHDLEDFFRAGLIPLERVATLNAGEVASFLTKAAHELERNPAYKHTRAGAAFERLQGLLPGTPYRGTHEDRKMLHTLTSTLIDAYFRVTKLQSSSPYLDVPTDARQELMLLKQLTWQYVVNGPALATLQRGQQKVVREVFQGISAWLFDEEAHGTPYRLPTRLLNIRQTFFDDRDAMDSLRNPEARCARIVSDYICSLTERQLLDLHRRLMGPGAATSILDDWVLR